MKTTTIFTKVGVVAYRFTGYMGFNANTLVYRVEGVYKGKVIR